MSPSCELILSQSWTQLATPTLLSQRGRMVADHLVVNRHTQHSTASHACTGPDESTRNYRDFIPTINESQSTDSHESVAASAAFLSCRRPRLGLQHHASRRTCTRRAHTTAAHSRLRLLHRAPLTLWAPGLIPRPGVPSREGDLLLVSRSLTRGTECNSKGEVTQTAAHEHRRSPLPTRATPRHTHATRLPPD